MPHASVTQSHLTRLVSWQRSFIDRYLAERQRRSALVAPPGTGTTVMALVIAKTLLQRWQIDSVLVLLHRATLATQWKDAGRPFLEGKSDGRPRLRVVATAAPADDSQFLKLLATVGQERLLVLVEEERNQPLLDLIDGLLAANAETRSLFLLRHDDDSVAFDATYRLDHQSFVGETLLQLPATKLEVAALSPSFGILEKMLRNGVAVDDLSWREFEVLVAETTRATPWSSCKARRTGASTF